MKPNLTLLNDISVHEFKTYLGDIFIHKDEIIYVKASDKKCELHCLNKKIYIVNHSMKELEKELEPPCFYRIHSSYLINCFYVEYINNFVVLICNNNKYEIPISKKKIFAFKRNIKTYKKLTFNS